MLTLSGYGVTLIQLDEGNLELLRNWRNTPEIAGNMEFREYISSESQQLWFNQIQTQPNYYFIISYHSHKIGLIHLNEFNKQQHTAHAGLFIAETAFTGTGISLGASLLVLSFAFEQLNLVNVYAKIKRDNRSALAYNKGLGFDFVEHLNERFSLYQLTAERFNTKKEVLKNLAKLAIGK